MGDRPMEIEWQRGPSVSREQLEEFSGLFSGHYGTYGTSSPIKPGQRVELSPDRLRKLLSSDEAEAWGVRSDGILIGYALVIRGKISPDRVVTWVTQLVVHRDHRHRGVAKRLLSAIWSFSDHFAWGLVSSNPYAVLALEKATRRRCDPFVISHHQDDLLDLGANLIGYIQQSKSHRIDDTQSIIDTEFYLDHSELPGMLSNASKEREWRLGEIDEGEEWFAFTFRTQDEFPIGREELARVLADADKIAMQAYESMTLDKRHIWAQRTQIEVDLICSHVPLQSDSAILDFGCGIGRHALELARRGCSVVGVDFAPRLVERAQESANREGLAEKVRFIHADCRDIELDVTFDLGLCLYDVIGTFPDDRENERIAYNLSRHLKPGGHALTSVLNLALVESIAIQKVDISKRPFELLNLKPSATMEKTGQIFDPDYFILDPATSLVYRKEQFTANPQFPREVLVRDRRYRQAEIVEMLDRQGIESVWSRHVQSGRWDVDLSPTDPRAKEILSLGVKR